MERISFGKTYYSDATRQSFAGEVTTALSQATDAPLVSQEEEEDSDEWLNIDAQTFDDMLEKSLGGKNKASPSNMDTDVDEELSEDKLAREQAARMSDLAKKVEAFVEGEGTLEGAKFEE